MEISDRDQAAFELGIKLGALFHQFVGTPISIRSKESLERAMEGAIENQPYVEEAEVRIDEAPLRAAAGREFDYISLEGRMIGARVTVSYRGIRCVGRLSYNAELEFPLMTLERMEEV
ncbi:MAG: dihydroneopterin aldolase family protein [Candidatus Hydrothermarchaeota archaeon]